MVGWTDVSRKARLAMAVKNWVYGVKHISDTNIINQIEEQVSAAHRYRNKLCEIELRKRERYYATLNSLCSEFVELSQQVETLRKEQEELRSELKLEKQRKLRDKSNSKVLAAKVKEIAQQLKELRLAINQVKQDAKTNAEYQEALTKNAEAYARDKAEARKASGLYWGTEALVNRSCDSFSAGAPPQFARWTGEGQLAVQFMNGLPVENILVPNTLFYISGEGRVRKACFRVNSTDKGRPVFVELDMVMHRPLPEGGVVKWAYLERRKLANKFKYKVRLAIEVPEPEPQGASGSMGILHLGWRAMENGDIRVGLISNGSKTLPIVLPWRYYDNWDKLDQLHSERRLAFNEAVAELIEQLRQAPEMVEVPEFVQEARKYAHMWKAYRRLVAFTRRMRLWLQSSDYEQYIGTDVQDWAVGVLDKLVAWEKVDRLKWQHVTRLTRRLCGWRNNVYRNLAVQLQSRVQLMAVAKIDVKKLTENSQPEDLQYDSALLHRRARLSAVATLRQYVAEKYPKRLIEVDATNVSVQCADCGHVNERNTSFLITCQGCGRTFDIDENACRNTATRAQEMVNNGHLDVLEAKAQEKIEKTKNRLFTMQEGRRKKAAARKQAASG